MHAAHPGLSTGILSIFRGALEYKGIDSFVVVTFWRQFEPKTFPSGE
jgi:hypothetical protein